jgi:hypothetical protein
MLLRDVAPLRASLVPASTDDELLRAVWAARCAGTRIACLQCGRSHVALSVTAQQRYRLSCVACTWQSAWFDAIPEPLRSERIEVGVDAAPDTLRR